MKIAKLKQLGIAMGIFTATVVISYAASSLIPTYAPGDNPPDLDSAPLIYKMAGNVDPSTFDASDDSLEAISDKIDNLPTTGGGSARGGDPSSYAFNISSMMKIVDGDLYARGYSGHNCELGFSALDSEVYEDDWYLTLRNVEKIESSETSYSSGAVGWFYSYVATRTDGTRWVSGRLAYGIRGSVNGDCRWVQIPEIDPNDSATFENPLGL